MSFIFADLENEVTKSLIAFRNKEVAINNTNAKAVPELVKHSYDGIYGNGSKQSCIRTNTYEGFKFTESSKIDLKEFKQKDIEGYTIFMPNARTKVSRAMKNALNNLPCVTVFNLFDLILFSSPYSFAYPYLELFNGIPYLFVDDKTALFFKDRVADAATGITKAEFDKAFEDHKNKLDQIKHDS